MEDGILYMNKVRIQIWGIGCTLLSDQGFGISVIQDLERLYHFDESVELVDGGLVGVGVVGLMAGADHLIAVDAVRNNGMPGTFYRWEGRRIFERFTEKSHVQQVAFLEALAHCQLLDHPPRTVLLAIEPDNTERLACKLTPGLETGKKAMIHRVLTELNRLGAGYQKKRALPICA
jgi:hydrogenase maturation protease